ncbi:hypothetical protein M0802_011147 [Mischocyttarus mexicanus]|nr:hypothetical protein M0802_011147 [Mischocyttarus mexicanus]
MSDYDALREQNIAKRNAVFAEFFNEVNKLKEEDKHFQEDKKVKNFNEYEPPSKKRKINYNDKRDSTYKNKLRLEFHKEYNTRSRSTVSASDTSNDSDYNETTEEKTLKKSTPRLRVLFPWAKPFQRSIDLMVTGICDVDQKEEEYETDDDDEKEYNYHNNLLLSPDRPKRKKIKLKTSKSQYNLNSISSVDEVTQEMIDNVAKNTTIKKYSKINGISCHQCRQKTLDTKTICRSGECIGSRGKFCGPCLHGRYGEDIVKALKDPNWACPPCRGLCNCSLCRAKNGLAPTGILAPTVHEEGYSSVMDYLQSVENKNHDNDDDGDGDDNNK